MITDSFTASVMLSAISTNNNEETVNALSSLLNSLGESDPVPAEVVTFVESNIGKEVEVRVCGGNYYKGVVHSCNKAQSGEYPGVREPVYVKITGSVPPGLDQAIGMVFEYSLDRITFI